MFQIQWSGVAIIVTILIALMGAIFGAVNSIIKSALSRFVTQLDDSIKRMEKSNATISDSVLSLEREVSRNYLRSERWEDWVKAYNEKESSERLSHEVSHKSLHGKIEQEGKEIVRLTSNIAHIEKDVSDLKEVYSRLASVEADNKVLLSKMASCRSCNS